VQNFVQEFQKRKKGFQGGPKSSGDDLLDRKPVCASIANLMCITGRAGLQQDIAKMGIIKSSI